MPIYSCLKEIGFVEQIDFFLVSTGGDIDGAFKIVSLLRQYCNKLTIIIPFVAKSAATLLSLGADELIMGPPSELGPIDPQVSHPSSKIYGPAQAIRDCIDFVFNKVKQSEDPGLMLNIMYPVIDKLDPFLLGNFERAVKVSKQYAKKLLSENMLAEQSEEEINKIVDVFAEGYYSHGFVIDKEEAKKLCLNVLEPDEELWDVIWKLYIQYMDELSIYNEEEKKCIYEHLALLRDKIDGLYQFLNNIDTTGNRSDYADCPVCETERINLTNEENESEENYNEESNDII